MAEIADRARALVRDDDKGGFPPQEQEPPGLTSRMDPPPDHGEDTYVGHGRLDGLRAFITGGDSGIGRAVAIAFAREGADVAIGYLPRSSPTPRTPRLVRRPGGRRARARRPHRPRDLPRVVADAVDGLGGLDILVNNAGYHWARGPEGLAGLRSRAGGAGAAHQPARRALDVPGRPRRASGDGARDHQHDLDPGLPPVAGA